MENKHYYTILRINTTYCNEILNNYGYVQQEPNRIRENKNKQQTKKGRKE